MAVVDIPFNPQLTPEFVREVFARHFEGRCRIEDGPRAMVVRRDFVVVRNSFVGVGVKLEQGANETKFVFAGLAPRLWARLLVSGLLSMLLWNGLTNEVRTLIEAAPEFREGVVSAA